MTNFKKIWKTWSLIAFFISIIGLIYFRLQAPTCSEYYKKAKLNEFNGIVENKFIDKKQHNYKIIILFNKSALEKIILNTDKSGFYEYIKEGDSIIKETGSYKMKVFKKSKIDTIFILYYGC